MSVLIYLILLATQAVVLATRQLDPSLLYRVTREDGIVEWATVLALVGVSFICLRLTPKDYPSKLKVAAYALGILCIIAIGEEVSWGQRIFEFETSESFKELNHQNETNLHNLIPAPLFNGIIIFGTAIVFTLIPMLWRKLKGSAPWWVPNEEISTLTLAVVLVNHYRVTSMPEKIGLGFLFILLIIATIQALASRKPPLIIASTLGWMTAGVLYSCRFVLPEANAQYEIRELLVILLVAKFCRQLQTQKPAEES